MVESNEGAAPQGSGASNDTTAHFTDEFVTQLAALEAGVTPEEMEAISALPSGSEI